MSLDTLMLKLRHCSVIRCPIIEGSQKGILRIKPSRDCVQRYHDFVSERMPIPPWSLSRSMFVGIRFPIYPADISCGELLHPVDVRYIHVASRAHMSPTRAQTNPASHRTQF